MCFLGESEQVELLQARTRKYIAFLVELVPVISSIFQNTLLYNMRIMGQAYPDLLVGHRKFIENMKREPGFKDTCQMMIDVIEGRR